MKLEKANFSIVSKEDISHGGAKRYGANVIIEKYYSRFEIKKIIKKVTAELIESNFYRSEIVWKKWGNTPAHVVWLYIYKDQEDIKNVNWICMSEFIDPNLEKNMRPNSLNGDDKIDGIEIEWNLEYNRNRKTQIEKKLKGEWK